MESACWPRRKEKALGAATNRCVVPPAANLGHRAGDGVGDPSGMRAASHRLRPRPTLGRDHEQAADGRQVLRDVAADVSDRVTGHGDGDRDVLSIAHHLLGDHRIGAVASVGRIPDDARRAPLLEELDIRARLEAENGAGEEGERAVGVEEEAQHLPALEHAFEEGQRLVPQGIPCDAGVGGAG